MFEPPKSPESGPSPRPSEGGDLLGQMPWHQGRRAMLRHLILSWFGCGMSPWAPGTVGSLGSLPLGLLLYWSFGAIALAACAAVLFVAGWLLADAQLRHDGGALQDPQ